ncbi:MAG: hypothetical protein KG003_06620 [Bacteroidetes bacterium]|nr:hypothetical protein [Bacteroidota bacterium]
MKNLFLAILTLLFALRIQAQVYYKSATFDIIQAVKSTQFPGVMGSPIVTTVNFKMILKKCTRLSMDSFWMDGFSDRINISYANGEHWDSKPLKGDTLNISLVYYRLTTQEGYPQNELGINGSPQNAAPVKHSGEALFRYSMSGKQYYFSIKKIKQGENIYAP